MFTAVPGQPTTSVWAVIALALGSVVPILGMPLIVGSIEDHWHLNAAFAGYVTSVDLAGLFIGSVFTAARPPAGQWLRYIAACIVVCCAANIACVWWHQLPALFILRFIAGLAAGMTYASSLTLLARAPDSVRGFSLMVFYSVIANAVVIIAFPTISDAWGPGGLFVAVAAGLVGSLIATRAIPAQLFEEPPRAAPVARGPQVRSTLFATALCIGAISFVYMAIGCYWAYAERMGLSVSLSADTVHHLLTAGVLLSALGCLAAFRIARVFGQSKPLLAALALLSIVLAADGLDPTRAMYIITLVVFQICWNFIDIYQLGTLAVIDPSGRSCALVPAAQGVALALGPAVGGLALTIGRSYTAVLLVAACAAAAAAICYAVVHSLSARAEFVP